MGPHLQQQIAVVGVGNTIRSDDGAGVHALGLLRHDPRLPAGVSLIDGGSHGIELLAYLNGVSHLLLLDAVDTGAPAGALVHMAGDELRGFPGGASVHQLGIADLLATLPLISDMPREIVLLGVQPESTDWGTALSPPVEAALGPLVEAAIEQLARWTAKPAAGVAAQGTSPDIRLS